MRQAKTRQRVRLAILIVSLILFPITMNYLSPYVILYGASQGIINGSFIVFGLLFLSSLFFGRMWCSWICPAGGLGEVCRLANDGTLKHKWLDVLKWVIWVVWLGFIAFLAISAGGYKEVDFLLMTESGISVDAPGRYIIYLIVVAIYMGLALIFGRRAGCHSICWMAPFMILGRKLRNLFAWPSFRLKIDPDLCINCRKCTLNCPMSLDVNGMVNMGKMENNECILCAQCADVCPKDVIHLVFQSGK
ncbi:MAG: ferredoxin-type protein NapH [Chloroflexota bacterium]|nr:ferredoxin-type protein NapH [Chloroflexota bacterium]